MTCPYFRYICLSFLQIVCKSFPKGVARSHLKETKTDDYAELSELGIADGHNYYVVSAEGQRNAAPPYNPVRRSWQHVPGLLGCGFAAQNRKSRLSAAANKSCLKGRPFIIWSCRPAPYGNGQPVCAASTGRADSPACSGGGFRVEFFY